MNSTRFYKVTIALLVVINLTTLAYLWFTRPPMPPHPGEHPELTNDLGISGDAKRKVDALEVRHHKEKRALLDKDHALHETYFSMIGSGESTDSILAEIQANNKNIEEMTFDFFDQVAGYCTEEQKARLKEIISRRLPRMGPPPPPRH